MIAGSILGSPWFWVPFGAIALAAIPRNAPPGYSPDTRLWYILRDCLTISLMAMRAQKAVAKKRRTLYVKNPAAHRLAEQVSRRIGVTLSDAVISALEDKLRNTGRPLNRAKVDALCARIGALPVVDGRTAEEILGYDAFGIPR